MENSRLGTRILLETERLILNSCSKNKKSRELHKAIIKKYYNASDICIDYNRNRITMDVVVDDQDYRHSKINTAIATVPMSLSFQSICNLLRSCLEQDVKSLAFYARLLRDYANKDVTYMAL